ncbi:hypothetical protein, partial [Staphylococcus aureus]|uniref:hypothetical protein n=1 Tax=Staphylococcus aureus TaxID=1280 RepID=UPI00158374C5
MQVYRSYDPIDPNYLPDPLFTAPSGVLFYDDTSVEEGRIVWYLSRYVSNDIVRYSSQYCTIQLAYTGPTTVTGVVDNIIRGNAERGRMGTLDKELFPTPEEIVAEIGSAFVFEETTDYRMEKVISNGKVLFVPTKAIIS